MQKKSYLKEISISNSQKRFGANVKKDVEKIQGWLTLYAMQNPNAGTATGIDGDFGPATEQAVINFQKAKGFPQNGIVDNPLFELLVTPMKKAFENPISGNNLRELVVNVAKNHAANNPLELVTRNQSNTGPWVRAYMDGHEGTAWYWCMGFVQTIIDQATSLQGKNFKNLMPLSYSCDIIGTTGLQKKILTRYQNARSNPSLIQPGDIFLLQKSTYDWYHTGIVIGVNGDIIETIEGNTNSDGSNNGNAVLNKIRNFKQSKIDFFSIETLV